MSTPSATCTSRICCFDEIRTRLRSSSQVLWLWLALDPRTKIVPVLQLGPRTQSMAHRLIHSLRERLAPGCLPLFTSDGLNLYFYALTAHFGQWLQVGRRVALVQPRERGGKLMAHRYRQRTPAMAAGRTHRRWTTREVLSCPLPPVCA